jgi:VWFA-related protein
MIGTRCVRFGLLAIPVVILALAQTAEPPKPPSAARKLYERARKAADKRRIEEARRSYEAAIALFPDYQEAWCSLGLLQAEHDEFAAAMHSFRQAIRSDPKGICPYLPMAMLEHGAGDWNALVETTDRMLRLDSIDYPLAHLLKAAGHYNLGEYEEAEKAARAAEALDSRNFPKIWEVLGWTSVKKRNDVAAISQFQQYLTLLPDDPEAPAARRALGHLMERHPDIPREASSGPVFRVDSNLALLQFQLTPKRGQLIRRLTPGDIEVREDGVPQKTKLFEAGRSYEASIPVEITLLFDTSASLSAMGTVDPYMFHENILDEYENVSIAIYSFSDDLTRITKPTRDARTLKRAMDAVLTRPARNTRVFGAIRDVVREAAEGRSGVIRMIVVFSDGISETEGYDDEFRDDTTAVSARELGVGVYPVLLVNSYYASATQYMVAHGNPSIQHYTDLAEKTGGRRFVQIPTASALPSILKALSKEVLAYTHVAGYYTDASQKPKQHEAKVLLRNQGIGQLTGGSRIVVH